MPQEYFLQQNSLIVLFETGYFILETSVSVHTGGTTDLAWLLGFPSSGWTFYWFT